VFDTGGREMRGEGEAVGAGADDDDFCARAAGDVD